MEKSTISTFMDGAGDAGAGGDTGLFQQQSQQQQQPPLLPPPASQNFEKIFKLQQQNPRFSNLIGGGGRYAIENERPFDLPLRILIPNEFIGAIIGRGGSTIRAISKGTGARVDIFRHSNRYFEMPEKPISITGQPEKSSQACKKIMEIMAQEAIHQRGRGREHLADLPLKIFVPKSVVGRIIGKAGAVIKGIMEETETKIHISNQPDFLEQNMGVLPVSITGPPEKATQACKKIMEIMAQEPANQRGYEQYGDLALKIFVPNSVVGRIIGKAGAVIKEIMEETQTKIHISNQPDVLEQNMGVMRNKRIVTVRGSITGMVQAESMISSKRHEACQKIMEIMSQEEGQRGRENFGDLALKIVIPNSVVGRIIGKAGAVIKEIMEETQTKINISSDQPDFLEQHMGVMRTNRIVTVRGSIDGMVQAESVISSKLREAYFDGKVRDRDLDFIQSYFY